MKVIIGILLSACFLLQNISKTIIVLNYEAKKEYIAANLCVNRQKPESCCEGKCHLKSKLEQDDKSNNVPSSSNKQKFEKSEFCDNTVKSDLFNNLPRETFVSFVNRISAGIFSGIFRPPCC